MGEGIVVYKKYLDESQVIGFTAYPTHYDACSLSNDKKPVYGDAGYQSIESVDVTGIA